MAPEEKTERAEAVLMQQPKINGVGLFKPTCYWDKENKVLTIALEKSQMEAILHRANVPSDNSDAAIWGRKVAESVHQFYLDYFEQYGACEVHVVHRNYDGAPV